MSKLIFAGFCVVTVIIAIETYALSLSLLALGLAVPMLIMLYFMVQLQPRKFPIQFEKDQSEESRRLALAFVLAHRETLSGLLSASKDKDFPANVAEAVDAVIERERLPVNENIRQDLIRVCLLNPKIMSRREARRRYATWIIASIVLFGVPAYDIYNGESISTAIMPMIGAIISIPIVYFIFSRFLKPKIIQEHKALVERTIRHIN